MTTHEVDTTVSIERSVGLEPSEVKMFAVPLKRTRLVLKPDDTVVADGAVFLRNKLLMRTEG
jgi:hypothetical protein